MKKTGIMTDSRYKGTTYDVEREKDMMQELSALCAKLKLVGSYFSDEGYEK